MFSRTLLTALITLVIGTAFAEEPAQPTVRHINNKYGLSFDRPAGWRMTSETTEAGSIIRIAGPQNAMATIFYLKADVEPSLEEYTSRYVEIIATGLPALKLKYKETSRSFDSNNSTVKFVMSDEAGHKVPSTITIAKLTFAGRTAFYVTQVIDVGRPKAQPGFDQIRDTLAEAKKKSDPQPEN